MITVLDPSIGSENLGDLIIREAVMRELTTLFPGTQIKVLPTRTPLDLRTAYSARGRGPTFFGGTNALRSDILRNRQWRFGAQNLVGPSEVILLGVGWWQYQDTPSTLTRVLLRNQLHKQTIHAVRDEYTRTQLAKIGINNALNTSCPTLWELTDRHLREIPTQRAKTVLFTLTDYLKDPAADLHMVRVLKQAFRTVLFWPQGSGDLEYWKDLAASIEDSKSVNILPPKLEALDAALSAQHSIEYIGTRLHAGIRALQFKRRSLVVSVDNRATEISRDTRLAVLHRSEIHQLDQSISSRFPQKIQLNWSAIDKWRSQFFVQDFRKN